MPPKAKPASSSANLGVPCVQIELKTLGVNSKKAIEQIVDYKHDADNGHTKTLLCFMQLLIVSNRDRTRAAANLLVNAISLN